MHFWKLWKITRVNYKIAGNYKTPANYETEGNHKTAGNYKIFFLYIWPCIQISTWLITVYIVGKILTFMTCVLVFHWYEDYFPSRYLLMGRLIYYLSHTCKHSWPGQMIFSVISNFLLHCIVLYAFQQLTVIDESSTCLLPFQGLSWPTVWMNHVLPLDSHCLFFSHSFFVWFSEFLNFILPGHWVEYPYIKKCPLVRNAQPSSSNLYARLICDIWCSFV